MTKQKVRAIIDHREDDEVIAEVADHEEIEDWDIEQLDIGDIQFQEADVLIERKESSDYAKSLTQGRLHSQVERMQQASENCYILIDGDMSDYENWRYDESTEKAIRGSMASFMARDDIPVVFCSNNRYLVDLSVRIARKHIEEPTRAFINTGPIDNSEPTAKRMFACLDDVGPNRAETLYEEFETVQDLLNASIEDIQQLEGFGEKTAENIMQSLN